MRVVSCIILVILLISFVYSGDKNSNILKESAGSEEFECDTYTKNRDSDFWFYNCYCITAKNERCEDALFNLSMKYRNSAKEIFIRDITKYEQAFKEWEATPYGKEPQRPKIDYSRALNSYKTFVKDYPISLRIPEAYYQIASIYMIEENFYEAKKAYLYIINKAPQDIRKSAASYRLAMIMFQNKQYSEALKYLKLIDPQNLRGDLQELAHYRRAECFYQMYKYRKAEKIFNLYLARISHGEFQGILIDSAKHYLSNM